MLHYTTHCRLPSTIAHKGVRNTALCTCTAPDYKSKPHGETTSPPCDSYPHYLPAALTCIWLHTLCSNLSWGKNFEAWSKQCLHQNVTSSDFQHLKFTVSIEKAGFYKSSLQILRSSFPELCEWCYACSRKQSSMNKSLIREIENSSAEVDKTLIIWLQGRKCKQRVDSLNEK